MKKKIIAISIILVIIAGYILTSIYGSITYQNIPQKINNVDSIKEIVLQLIKSQENFYGSIDMKDLDVNRNTVEIKMTNYNIGDDTIIAKEYLIKAVHKESKWSVEDYKVHWKCRGRFMFDFWTTNACS